MIRTISLVMAEETLLFLVAQMCGMAEVVALVLLLAVALVLILADKVVGVVQVAPELSTQYWVPINTTVEVAVAEAHRVPTQTKQMAPAVLVVVR
jgi:hypothetical protein